MDGKRKFEDNDGGRSNKRREVQCPACNLTTPSNNLVLCQYCGNTFCTRPTCGPAHQASYLVDPLGHNCCGNTSQQCGHCLVNYCVAHCVAIHNLTFAPDPAGDNCCNASKQVCTHCNGSFCGTHSFGAHQTATNDATHHICCNASLQPCPHCGGNFCLTHNVPGHEIDAYGCAHKTCAAAAGKCPSCEKVFCEVCKTGKILKCDECGKTICDLCKPCLECSIKKVVYYVTQSISSNSFQSIFIRQLHTGKDDPQDHSARSIAACRHGLNTVTNDGLDIGIATWNINHFQKAEQKKASFQRIFFQHQQWLDILALQEVNASSKLEIDGKEIKIKGEKSIIEEDERIDLSGTRKLIYKPGPMMMGLGIGEAPKDFHEESRSEEVKSRLGFVGGKPAWLKPHQQEFYPLIYLEGGKYAIKYLTSAAFYLNELTDIADLNGKPLYWNKQFGTDGDGTEIEENLNVPDVSRQFERSSRSTRNKAPNYASQGDGNFDEEDGNFKSTKKDEKELKQAMKMRDIDPEAVPASFKFNVDLQKIPYFRPIIVHKLLIKGRLVNIAVVHTSPEGGKLARMGEYDQIAPFFKYVSNDDSGALWVIAGDYYLDPESNIASNSAQRTENPDELFKEQIKANNLKFVISVSATNQSILTKDTSTKRRKNLRERENLQDKIEANPEVIHNNLSKKIDTDLKQKFEEEYEIDPQSSSKKYIGLTKPYEIKIDSVERKTEEGPRHVVNKRADFFICSPEFSNTFAGIINPLGGLLNVDPNHNALNWWRLISDHVPVGAVVSTLPVSEKLRQIRADENMSHKERWEKAASQLSDLFHKAYNEIRGWYLYLAEEIRKDWNDGLYYERKLFLALLFYILIDKRFEAFQTVKIEGIGAMPQPDFAAAEMMEFFELCQVLDKDYDVFKAIYIKHKKLPFLLLGFYEAEIMKKWKQMRSSKLPRIVKEAAPALRTLGYEIDDFDVTDKEQTYTGVDNKAFT